MRHSLIKLAPIFLASGAAALIVETTWLRWFRLLLGATAPATSATLVAFFAGHALGAALGARFLGRVRRPLRIYGLLEWTAAGWALAVPVLLFGAQTLIVGVYDDLRAAPVVLTALRFGLALTVTLPAATCIGATLPFMGAAVMRSLSSLGSTGSALYAINTLGAVAGTAFAAFWLPAWIGVMGTYAVAVAIWFGAGAAALVLDRSAASAMDSGVPTQRSAGETARPDAAGRGLLGLAALSGFAAFAAQVLFVQAFALVLNQSVYAFGAVLVIVLSAVAIGALAISGAVWRWQLSLQTCIAWALGATALAFVAFPALFWWQTGGLRYVGSGTLEHGYLAEVLTTVASTAGPALLLASSIFPLTLALAAGRAERPARPQAAGTQLGRLLAANTVGAIAGALAAPFLLLPLLGLWGGFLGLACLYAAPALLLRNDSASFSAGRPLILAGGFGAVLFLANPLSLPISRIAPNERVLQQVIGASGLIAVIEAAGERLIRTDNHYALGGSGEWVHERRQGHLPLLLHGAATRVAFVGTATGISAGVARAHSVESVHLVEIVPAVAEAAHSFFADVNSGIYRDPRSELVLDDARNFFRSTRELFDVVVGDLFVPWRAGTSSLYTTEHFASVRASLRPGGLFCQWLPLYQLDKEEFRVIAASFLEVFPSAALFRGDFYGAFPIAALVGWSAAPAPVDEVAAAVTRLAASGERDRWVVNPLGIWSLYIGPLAPLVDANTARNTDDWPRVEFLSARGHSGAGGKQNPLVGLAWIRQAERSSGALAGDPIFAELGAEARRAVRGGAALQRAGALFVAGRHPEASQAFARAARDLPVGLIRGAEPDPTAAELWFDEAP